MFSVVRVSRAQGGSVNFCLGAEEFHSELGAFRAPAAKQRRSNEEDEEEEEEEEEDQQQHQKQQQQQHQQQKQEPAARRADNVERQLSAEHRKDP